VETFVGTIRESLCRESPTLSRLTDAINAVSIFKVAATKPAVESFRLLADRLDMVFQQHVSTRSLPNKLECELIELAIDWLAELAILYEKNLPEPKSLVAELLYTFKLVESSHEAVTLAELLASHPADEGGDPFAEDPEVSVKSQSSPSESDPFADDPGVVAGFDLLQCTVNLENLPALDSVRDETDLFADDPPLSN
jgi:hypothetical protein